MTALRRTLVADQSWLLLPRQRVQLYILLSMVRVDSGASGISYVSDAVFYNLDNGQLENPDFAHVKGIAGKYLAVTGSCTLNVTLGNDTNWWKHH
jgi:hypothetical protein